MNELWLVVFGVLVVGCFALEGAAVGIALALPVLGRDEAERGQVIAALGPMVLLTEVWLVAAVGLLFGLYPRVEGELLSGLYPWVVLLLVAWVVRDAGVWFRGRGASARWRHGCEWMVCAGGVGTAVAWGLALGALATGDVFGLVGVVLALVVALLFGVHGVCVAARSWGGPRAVALVERPVVGGLSRPWVSGVLASVPVVVALATGAEYLMADTVGAGTLAVLAVFVLPALGVGAVIQWWGWRLLSRSGGLPERSRSFF